MRRKMVESAKESIKQKASNSEIYGKMQAVFIEMDGSAAVRPLVTTKIFKIFFQAIFLWKFEVDIIY